MSVSRFLLQALVTLCVMVGVNLAVQRLARNSIPNQHIAAINAAENVRYATLGHSLIVSGFDPTEFARLVPDSAGKTLIAAQNSTHTGDHMLIARLVVQKHPQTKYFIFGFLDRELTAPTNDRLSELYGNHAYAYLLEPSLAAQHYFPDSALTRTEFSFLQKLPMVVERGQVWGKVEQARRTLSNIGMSRAPHVDPFIALEVGNSQTFSALCKSDTLSKASLNSAVTEIFRSIKATGGHIVVINMPMSSTHRRQYYDNPEYAEYITHVGQLVRQAGQIFIDAKDWVDDSEFVDRIHLSPLGAKIFTRKLLEVWHPE